MDASSGVFRPPRRRARGSGHLGNGEEEEEEEDDPGELASLSLFRRISFAPDGSHICGTNATLRGKNIAAMISREGWSAIGSGVAAGDGGGKGGTGQSPPGAASLVGHKQPVVASRHCPILFHAPLNRKKSRSRNNSSSIDSSSSSEDDDGDIDYSTLVALGDKMGFVTIWSTRASRPLFKMQCSENRCTVTDLSWGLVRDPDSKGEGDSLILIVSLLDGYVVALRFHVPTEVGGGTVLPEEQISRIFRDKYGIEDYCGFNHGNTSVEGGRNRRLVDDAGPVLIENAFQITMEQNRERTEEEEKEADQSGEEKGKDSKQEGSDANQDEGKSIMPSAVDVRDQQVVESKKSGKKRIRPVLINADKSVNSAGNVSEDYRGRTPASKKQKRRKGNTQRSFHSLQGALDAAEQAAAAAEGASKQVEGQAEDSDIISGRGHDERRGHSACLAPAVAGANETGTTIAPLRIPCSTSKIFRVDLTGPGSPAAGSAFMSAAAAGQVDREDDGRRIVADCTNSISTPSPCSPSWPYANLTISCRGCRLWQDVLLRSRCTALVANDRILVVGTSDGCLHVYQTSPTLGWESGRAFRVSPPLVLGSPVAEVRISGAAAPCMVVVTSDGSFYVYALLPTGPTLRYKGSIVPAMQHMQLSSSFTNQQQQQLGVPTPKLVRIQVTYSGQLMLILALPPTKSTSGRILQGFVYNKDMELWMRVSDTNDCSSDFYSSLSPCGIDGVFSNSSNNNTSSRDVNMGILERMDRLVRSNVSTMASAKQIYHQVSENHNNNGNTTTNNLRGGLVTRSFCEDRLACAIALRSAGEFQTWLRYYAQCLSSVGDGDALRFLVDVLLGSNSDGGEPPLIPSILLMAVVRGNEQSSTLCLGLEGKDVIRQIVLPEMSKNRLLQRLTNEISMEIECL